MNSENKLVIEQLNKFGRVPQTHELLQMIEQLQQENKKQKEIIENSTSDIKTLIEELKINGKKLENEDIEINKQQVEDLVDTCKQVLKEKSKAKTLLPNTEGFFFGSTEYDEMYFDNVKLVLQRFQHLLKTFNFEKDKLIMSCSW